MPDSTRLGPHVGYFTNEPADVDPEIAQAAADETARQQSVVELIASENIVSRAVMRIHATPLINKTIEGYPGKRYHGGAEHVDRIETLAIERTKQLFGCTYANVQPHSGTQANQAVFLSLLNPGDTVLAMALDSGGHLSHGASANMAGKWFNIVEYAVDPDTGCIDYDDVRRLALEHQPRLVIAGGSAYARALDFPRFRAIADEVGAKLLVDMAHFAGLVAGGAHPDPMPYADVATATTYKNLRGPRGAVILTNDADLARRLNSAVFPGMQGSPQLHTIAAKAICLKEALAPDFEAYARQVLANARTLASRLSEHGLAIVGDGTDTPIVLVDLRPKGVTGGRVEEALERAGITCNKNAVPFDPEKPTVTSGLRLGTSAGTTRGFAEAEFRQIADWIAQIVAALGEAPDQRPQEDNIRAQVETLCGRFPIYPDGI